MTATGEESNTSRLEETKKENWSNLKWMAISLVCGIVFLLPVEPSGELSTIGLTPVWIMLGFFGIMSGIYFLLKLLWGLVQQAKLSNNGE